MAVVRLRSIWENMRNRCNPGTSGSKDYGDRGITVCNEWNTLLSFTNWAFANGYSPELTLDRINVDGGYSPDNCRFATATQQARNRRNNVLTVEAADQIKIYLNQANLYQREIGEIFGVSRRTINHIKTGATWQTPTAVRTLSPDFQIPDEGIMDIVRIRIIWVSMRQRCRPGNLIAKNYGDRGITVCPEWNTFLPFYNWSVGNGYSPKLSIDRIDNDGNYSPDNCKWSTAAEQGQNRRSTKLTMETASELKWCLLNTHLTHQEIANIYGVSKSTINNIKNRWDWKSVEAIEPKEIQHA